MPHPTVPLRVHLAPVGYEVKRVTEPLVRLKADRAYLLTFTATDSAKKYWVDVHRTLQTEYKSIEVRDRFEDVWDFHRVLALYGSIIREETASGNLVFVNVSSGTKITAMVGLLSSMFWSATPYYARTSYGGGTEVVHDVAFLPLLRFDVLPREGRQVLLDLKRQGRPIPKEELIRSLRKLELLPPEEGLSLPATYRRLDGLLAPLIERGFAQITGQGRASRIQLTDEGRAALLLLEHIA